MARTTVRNLKVRIKGEEDLSAAMGRIDGAADKLNKTTKQQQSTMGNLGKTWAAAGAKLGVVAAALWAAKRGMDAISGDVRVAESFKAQGLSIDAARGATRGLIADYDLMLARSRAVAFQLDLTDEAFAKLARGASVMARRVGIDAAEAFNRLILGAGKAETELLDELGFKLDQNKAFADYADQIGKTTKALTDVDKKAAVVARIMEQLDERVGEAKPRVDDLASAWERVGTQVRNFGTAMADAANRGFKATTDFFDTDTEERLERFARKLMQGKVRAGHFQRTLAWFESRGVDVAAAFEDRFTGALEAYRQKIREVEEATEDAADATQRFTVTEDEMFSKTKSLEDIKKKAAKAAREHAAAVRAEAAEFDRLTAAVSRSAQIFGRVPREQFLMAFEGRGGGLEEVGTRRGGALGLLEGIQTPLESPGLAGLQLGTRGQGEAFGPSAALADPANIAAAQQEQAKAAAKAAAQTAALAQAFSQVGNAAINATGDMNAFAVQMIQVFSQMFAQMAAASLPGPAGLIASAGIGLLGSAAGAGAARFGSSAGRGASGRAAAGSIATASRRGMVRKVPALREGLQ